MPLFLDSNTKPEENTSTPMNWTDKFCSARSESKNNKNRKHASVPSVIIILHIQSVITFDHPENIHQFLYVHAQRNEQNKQTIERKTTTVFHP